VVVPVVVVVVVDGAAAAPVIPATAPVVASAPATSAAFKALPLVMYEASSDRAWTVSIVDREAERKPRISWESRQRAAQPSPADRAQRQRELRGRRERRVAAEEHASRILL
jgi:hypothetical protein